MIPTWDDTWMRVTDAIAARSRCVRRQAGVVIVSVTNRVVAVGYNGPPAHLPLSGLHCDSWCPRATDSGDSTGNNYDNCLTIHAEINALLVCDRRDREGGTIYINAQAGAPCFDCAKAIANSGLARLVIGTPMPKETERWQRARSLLINSGVRVDIRARPL